MNNIQIVISLFESDVLLDLAANEKHLISVLTFVATIVIVCYSAVFSRKKKIGEANNANNINTDENKEEENEGTK